jgi:hypothetical protein
VCFSALDLASQQQNPVLLYWLAITVSSDGIYLALLNDESTAFYIFSVEGKTDSL